MKRKVTSDRKMRTAKRPRIPKAYARDVERAAKILREAGCTHVYLFGSAAHGDIRDDSDIDLAVRGCRKGQFFPLLGRLLLSLDHPVDLIDLDKSEAFAQYLVKEGELLPVV